MWKDRYTATAWFTILVSFAAVVIGYKPLELPSDASIFDTLIAGIKEGFLLDTVVKEVTNWGVVTYKTMKVRAMRDK